jgi:hypothetical protein
MFQMLQLKKQVNRAQIDHMKHPVRTDKPIADNLNQEAPACLEN